MSIVSATRVAQRRRAFATIPEMAAFARAVLVVVSLVSGPTFLSARSADSRSPRAFAPEDTNCNNAVTAQDALQVLGQIAMVRLPVEGCDADVDGDNDVDLADAQCVLQSVAGLPSCTPPPGCEASTGEILALDKVGEVVTVIGQGSYQGWYLISERGNQRFNFPDSYVANGMFTVRSNAAQFPNTQENLWWTTGNVWNDTLNDDALLFDCIGQLRDTFEDGD